MIVAPSASQRRVYNRVWNTGAWHRHHASPDIPIFRYQTSQYRWNFTIPPTVVASRIYCKRIKQTLVAKDTPPILYDSPGTNPTLVATDTVQTSTIKNLIIFIAREISIPTKTRQIENYVSPRLAIIVAGTTKSPADDTSPSLLHF